MVWTIRKVHHPLFHTTIHVSCEWRGGKKWERTGVADDDVWALFLSHFNSKLILSSRVKLLKDRIWWVISAFLRSKRKAGCDLSYHHRHCLNSNLDRAFMRIFIIRDSMEPKKEWKATRDSPVEAKFDWYSLMVVAFGTGDKEMKKLKLIY